VERPFPRYSTLWHARCYKLSKRSFRQAGEGGQAISAKAVTVGKKKTSKKKTAKKRQDKADKSNSKPPAPLDCPDPRVWPLEKR
jgi:hypothetical protein